MIFARSLKLNSIPYFKLFYYRNYWNFYASFSEKAYPKSIKYFLAYFTDILYVFSPSEIEPVSLCIP